MEGNKLWTTDQSIENRIMAFGTVPIRKGKCEFEKSFKLAIWSMHAWYISDSVMCWVIRQRYKAKKPSGQKRDIDHRVHILEWPSIAESCCRTLKVTTVVSSGREKANLLAVINYQLKSLVCRRNDWERHSGWRVMKYPRTLAGNTW